MDFNQMHFVCRSTEDLSPSYVDRNTGTTFYDRSSRVSAAIATGSGSGSGGVAVDSSDIPPQPQYIRRPSSNSYHSNSSSGGGSVVNNGSGGSSVGAGATIAGGICGTVAAIGSSASGDVRGRARDRPYRNGPFTPVIDRYNRLPKIEILYI